MTEGKQISCRFCALYKECKRREQKMRYEDAGWQVSCSLIKEEQNETESKPQEKRKENTYNRRKRYTDNRANTGRYARKNEKTRK